jgi:hypothetical protein
MAKIFISPVDISRKVFMMAAGMPATMPAKMISEIPLPIPRSVICSPSHMMNAVPAVSVKHRHQPESPSGRPSRWQRRRGMSCFPARR